MAGLSIVTEEDEEEVEAPVPLSLVEEVPDPESPVSRIDIGDSSEPGFFGRAFDSFQEWRDDLRTEARRGAVTREEARQITKDSIKLNRETFSGIGSGPTSFGDIKPAPHSALIRAGLEEPPDTEAENALTDYLRPGDAGKGRPSAEGRLKKEREQWAKYPKDPHGFVIDPTRQILQNEDGSQSTESSITVENEGRFFNIPTIINGKRVHDNIAIKDARSQAKKGWIHPNFATEQEAIEAAQARSDHIMEARKLWKEREPDEPEEPKEEKPEDPWGMVLWDTLTNVPAMFKRQYGGAKMFLHAPRDLAYILEHASDQGVAPEDSFALEVEAYVQGKEPAELYGEMLKEAAAEVDLQEGLRIHKEATDYLQDYAPNVREDSIKYYASAIIEGSINMAPALIATAAIRNANVGAALMGGQVFADQYAESISEGRSHSQAVTDGIVFGAAEVLTERIPLGILTKEGGTLLKRFLKAGGAEALQEPLTQLIQEAYTKGFITEEMTFGEALIWMTTTEEGLQMLKRSAIIGFGVGGSLATVVHPFYKGVTQEELDKDDPTTDDDGKKIRKPRPKVPSEQAGEISTAEAEEMGLTKVDVDLDLLERMAAGDPLTIDEQYTLTEEGYGQFFGADDRVMTLPKGLRDLKRLRAEVEAAAPVTIEVAEIEPVEIEEEREAPPEAVEVEDEGTRRAIAKRVDDAANLAATSKKSEAPFPTDEQIRAGNYKKGHLLIQSVPISIENPRLSVRRGVDKAGKKWESKLTANYGYVKGVVGKDKDQIDVFVGPNPRSNQAVVINQKANPNLPLSEKNFDEHKIMMGYDSIQDAIDGYLSNYAPGWQGLGSAVAMTVPQLRQWMDTGNTKKIAPEQTVTEEGVEFSEGDPVTFTFMRNTEAAPTPPEGDPFQQNIEPSGTYVTHKITDVVPEGWIEGEITLKKPLVIPVNARGVATERTYDKNSWKNLLSQQYDGKTSTALTEALRADGYDGIVTTFVNKLGVPTATSEIVVLKQIRKKPERKTRLRRIERQKTNEGKGTPRAEVQNALRPMYRLFRTVPPVRVVEAIEDLPQHLRISLDDDFSKQNTTGMYDQGGLKDNIYIISNNVTNTNEAIETMLHEVVGHYGLRQVVDPAQFNEVMDEVAKSFGKEIREISNSYNLDFTDVDERRIAAEEFIAHTAQRVLLGQTVTDKAKALLTRIVEAVKNALRRLTGQAKLFTTGQIMSIIAQSSNYVQTPGGYQRDKRRGALRHTAMPWYYSQMFKVINDDQAKSRSPANWNQFINAMVKKGRIKEEEVKWSGIREFIKDVTWSDIYRYTHEHLPVLMQNQVNLVDDLRNKIQRWGREHLMSQVNEHPEWNDLQILEKGLAKLGEETAKKIPKQAILKYIQVEGTQIDVMPPGESGGSAPQFDEDHPDEEELQVSEDEFFEEFSDWKYGTGSDFSVYVDDALKEVHTEHKYDPDLDEEENEAEGWDGTSEDDMRVDADERATELFEAEYWQDKYDEWTKKNTRKSYYLGDYRVKTDSDGDYVLVYDPSDEGGDWEELGYSSTESGINDMIEQHAEDHGGTRWKEYVLPGGENYEELLFRWTNPDGELFKVEGHWGNNDNMVAHARFDERKDLRGRSMMFIDEIQSDWHQEARDSGIEDPVLALELAEKQRGFWQQYLNEYAPEIQAEMLDWGITDDIANTFAVADVASKEDAIALLSSFAGKTRQFDKEIDKAVSNRTRIGLVDLMRSEIKKVTNTHRWDPTMSKEGNVEAGWDGTSEDDMQQEAASMIRADETQMQEIRSNVISWGTPEPITWEEWLDNVQKSDIQADQRTQGLGGEMRFATLYTAMAPRLKHDTKLQLKRAAEAGKDPEPLKYDTELQAKLQLLLLDYSEVSQKRLMASSGISPAPFEKTWQLLVMKYMIREAVNRGHKTIGMAPGEVHGFRWGGATEVDRIAYQILGVGDTRTPDMFNGKLRSDKNRIVIIETDDGRDDVIRHETTIGKLSSVVGLDVALAITNSGKNEGFIDPRDVGRGFLALPRKNSDVLSGGREIYNVITPNIVNKFLKKYKTKMILGAVRSQVDLEKESVKTIEGYVEASAYKDHGVRKLSDEEKSRLVVEDSRDLTWYSMHKEDGEIIEGQVSQDPVVPQNRLDQLRTEEVRRHSGFEAWTIEITPELEKAAKTGFPLFAKRKRPTGDPGLDEALKWANENIGPSGPRSIQRLQERINEVLRIENKQAKMEQALIDQFAGLKWAIRQTHGHELPAEISGYKQAHFTTSMDSQMYVFLTHGVPYWEKVGTGTVTAVKPDSRGLLEVLEPVADKIELWGYWKAAVRAKRLLEEGREHLFTAERIDELLKLGGDAASGIEAMFPEFQDVSDEFNDWKTQFLDWASEAGVINEDSRALWDTADYVPFYRIKSDELGGSFAKRAGLGGPGIANVTQPIKRLLGSKHPLGDIMENILINFQHIAMTTMKNKAAQLAIENLKDSGLVTPAKGQDFLKQEFIPMDELKKKLKQAGVDWEAMSTEALEGMQKMWTLQRPAGDQFISVLYNGQKKWFEVHEETLLRSLTAINERKFSSVIGRMFMWPFRKFKRLGTTMITLAPDFMAANWFRDIFMAFVNARHSTFPKPWSAATGAWKAFTKSPEMVAMMAAGGAFYSGYINANDPVATSKALKRALRQKGFKNRILDAPWKLFHFYNDIGAAAENANRIGTAYIPAIKAGVGKAEAVWEAKDIMNFAKHGDHALMQFFAQSVMFLNARIQGLTRYGQRFKTAPGLTFAKSMMYAMAVLAIWLKNKDDDRYKALPPDEKDMYVHFWTNGKHWRLPKSFEVGMIFGVGVERMFEYYYSNEDDAGKVAIDRMWFVFGEVFNFFNRETIVPLPQMIAPLFEATNNWNAFFQSPIVPEYMQDIAAVKPEIVFRPSTSPTMREIARGMPKFAPATLRNPLLLEHLTRGYLATLGAYVMMMSDDLVRKQFDYPARPALRWNQVPVAKRFYSGEDPPSRTMFEEVMYQVRDNARQIERAVNQLEKLEMDDEIDEFLEEPSKYDPSFTNQQVLDAAQAMESSYQQIKQLRKDTNDLWEDEEMTPEQKLRELNQLYQEKLENAKDAWMERPGAEIQFEALQDTLIDMVPEDRFDFLVEQGLESTADLLASMPKKPSNRMRNIIWENSA